MLYLTRRARFSASHRLFRPELSDAENMELFGKCATPGGHGHNYVIEVTVTGTLDPRTGMVVDLKKVKEVLEREVVGAWDHRHLNDDVPGLAGVIPTTENLAIAAWKALEGRLFGARLHRVRLSESDNNWVDYFGPAGRREET